MADRRLPYVRRLAVLRVLSWPYRYPPLSWYVAFTDWLAAKNSRLAVATVISGGIVVWAVIVHG